MPDLEFRAFDAETVGNAVRQPPLADLRGTARTRQRRRIAVALATVAALGATALTPVTIDRYGTDPAGSGDPLPRSPFAELVVFGSHTAVAVRLAEDNCSVIFTRTTDDGQTWSREGRMGHTLCEGSSRPEVRYVVLSERTYLVSYNQRVYATRNGGLAWSLMAEVSHEVDAFPRGAHIFSCLVACFGVPEPLATDPITGVVFRLRSRLPHALAQMYVTDDGTMWGVLQPGDWPQPALLVKSADRGKTWETAPVPAGTRAVGIAARDSREAYLLLVPDYRQSNPDRSGPTRVRRTTDGGRTWTEVTTDLPHSDATRPFTVASDGALMLIDGTGQQAAVWVSRDGGAHFTKGAEIANPGNAGGLPGRLWTITSSGTSVVTENGEHWRSVLLPAT
ncbi:sialidase family protein [Micromonospora sp. NPDC049679]|uniref:sialidase family protein n=1 Tax=Micromonospora sp. NPDC049679 TaxID=3155920 RepID=UPI00340897F1